MNNLKNDLNCFLSRRTIQKRERKQLADQILRDKEEEEEENKFFKDKNVFERRRKQNFQRQE